jgi:uncharacterized protein YlxW (UPF0749 family)
MVESQEAIVKEATRWRERERKLQTALRQVEEERRRLDQELIKVEEQVSYYDSLTREMKRAFGRPGISSFLSSLRKS